MQHALNVVGIAIAKRLLPLVGLDDRGPII